MPTYTLSNSLTGSLSDRVVRVALANQLASVFLHQDGLGFRVTNIRVQGGNVRIDTDVAIDTEQLAHLGLS